MPGQLHPDKHKVRYAEWNPVLAELEREARRNTPKGKKVNTGPLIREITLKYANVLRQRRGAKPLKLNTSDDPVSTRGKRTGSMA